MVTKPQKQHYTIEEWVAIEKATGIRHEYIDGEIYAMSGGTLRHGEISGKVSTALNNRLSGKGCHVYSSDVAVRISDTKYVYPDASALCGKPIPADDAETRLTNPTLVAEVVSKSSAYYDLGEKADYYFSVSSIQTYLVIDQNKPHVRVYTKDEKSWSVVSYAGRDAIVPVPSLDIELCLSELYLDIEFEPDFDPESEDE